MKAFGELEHEIQQFIDLVLRKDFDHIFAVGRKGLALLRIAVGDEAQIIEKVIVCDKILYYPWWGLAGKKIVVLDDAIATGRQIALAKAFLENVGAKVEVAVLAVREDVPLHLLPDHYAKSYWKIPRGRDYQLLIADLNELLHETCLPLDYDHVVLQLGCDNLEVERFWQALREFGTLEHYAARQVHEGVLHTSLFPNESISASIAAPSHFVPEGVVKIRLYVEGDGKIHCVPMAFYREEVEEPRANLCFGETPAVRFCAFMDRFRGITSAELCQDCANFNLSLQLGVRFLRRALPELRQEGMNVALQGFNERIVRCCYFLLQDEVVSVVDRTIELVGEA